MTQKRFTENPFYVLGLRPDCSRADLEREGQKLLAMLELQLESTKTYPTPLGPMPRTPDAVRQAMAELRDPQRRLLHELWAQLPPTPEPTTRPTTGPVNTSDTGLAATSATGPAAASAPDQVASSTAGSAAAPGQAASSTAGSAAAPGQAASSTAGSAAASDAAGMPASAAPPAWPQARAALGFGARR